MYPAEVSPVKHSLLFVATFLCLLSGVDVGALCPGRFSGAAKLKKIYIFAVRLLLCVELTLFNLNHIVSRFRQLSSQTSSTDFLRVMMTALYAAVLAQSVRSLWTNQAFLKEMCENPLHLKFFGCWRTLFYLLGWTWYTMSDVLILADDIANFQMSLTVNWTLPLWCSIHSKQCQYAIYLLFSQCQAVLEGHLDQLNAVAGVASCTEILSRKRVIRQITANMNETFATTFGLFYVQVFVRFHLFSSYQLLRLGQRRTVSHAYLGPFVHMFMLYDSASSGSKIVRSCQHTAFKILSQKRKSQSRNDRDCDRDNEDDGDNDNPWPRVTQIMSYDEQQDSLTVLDCFPLTKKSLFSYASMLITCVAVLLQFDYRLMAKLDKEKLHFNNKYNKQE